MLVDDLPMMGLNVDPHDMTKLKTESMINGVLITTELVVEGSVCPVTGEPTREEWWTEWECPDRGHPMIKQSGSQESASITHDWVIQQVIKAG